MPAPQSLSGVTGRATTWKRIITVLSVDLQGKHCTTFFVFSRTKLSPRPKHWQQHLLRQEDHSCSRAHIRDLHAAYVCAAAVSSPRAWAKVGQSALSTGSLDMTRPQTPPRLPVSSSQRPHPPACSCNRRPPAAAANALVCCCACQPFATGALKKS